MTDILDRKFTQWTRGKDPLNARRSVYFRVRDIPYGVIPELHNTENYLEILKYGKGSCTPKHILLGKMFEKLGLLVLFAVFPYRWDQAEIDYPLRLKKLAMALPTSNHLACKVDIDGKLVIIDATIDLALGRLGIPVNRDWDGISDTLLPIKPCGEEKLYHSSEIDIRQTHYYDENTLTFYYELNSWLEKVRSCPESNTYSFPHSLGREIP